MANLIIPTSQSYDSVVTTLISKANEIKENSVDYCIDNVAEGHIEMTAPNILSLCGGRNYALTDFASAQYCARLGFPILYYRKLVGSASDELRELTKINCNTLMRNFNGSMLVRTTNSTVRGVLSKKYVAFDTPEILDVFNNTLQNYDDLTINKNNLLFRGYYNTPDRFHTRFTLSVPLTDVPDRDLYAGLVLDSSDVGKAKLSVRFYIYKKVCTNGLCLPTFSREMFVQKHIGIQKDDFYEGLRHSLAVFPTTVGRVKDFLNHANSISLRDSEVLAPEIPEHIRKALCVYFRFTDEEICDTIDIFKAFYPKTIWGFTNAVTHKAREFDFDRRMVTETLAGNFMSNYRSTGII